MIDGRVCEVGHLGGQVFAVAGTRGSSFAAPACSVVGEMDRNVDPASTMHVANALINANKDFDFVVVPGAGHGVAGTPYGKRRLQDFFVRHLLAREPRRTETATN